MGLYRRYGEKYLAVKCTSDIKSNMKKNKLIGRLNECKRLDTCMKADLAQLVIVYGRRRVE